MTKPTNPVDIYVGCTEEQMLVTRVLEASVRRRTRRQIRIFPLYQYAVEFSLPKDPKNSPGTPFSFSRFMIPEIADFKGRAIYMDCDQIVFKDIAKLADRKIGPSGVSSCNTRNKKRKLKPSRRSSMMLIDCDKAGWRVQDLVADLDAGRYTYNDLFGLESYDHDIPGNWNSLDCYIPGRTALLHYTKKKTQPWINNINYKRGPLWMNELFRAIDEGVITEDEVQKNVDREFVRPSLAYQVKHRQASLKDLPADERKRDEPFIEACAANQFNNVPGEYAAYREKPD